MLLRQETRLLVIAAHPDDEYLGCGGLLTICRSRCIETSVLIYTTGADDPNDVRLDTLGTRQIADRISEHIQNFSPSVICTHSPTDINQDHRAIYHATRVASRPGHNRPITLLTYEVVSSAQEPPFEPNLYLPLSLEVLSEKQRLFASTYPHEVKEPPHPRSIENIWVTAVRRGIESGHPYAEAYRLIHSNLEISHA